MLQQVDGSVPFYSGGMSGWVWDEKQQLGAGGFGSVYQAQGPGGERLAAKVVPKADGATREQLIADDTPASPHVVPILHVAETDDSFVLFMPRADYSLRDRVGSGITTGDAIAILIEVATALSVIAPVVVHRDIKPDNVLFLDGHWALCDFGIARYADAATAQDTRKFALSAGYAAPEQWRYAHATSATDVYAFGVMAYELLSGKRPFSGTREELREQHLSTIPPILPGNRKLSWIVSECLQKAPEARPSAAILVGRLGRAAVEAETKGASALAAAQSAILHAQATEQAKLEEARTEIERREALAASASVGYSALVEQLVEFITDSAPATMLIRSGEGVSMTLGQAMLTVDSPIMNRESEDPFDVISYGKIHLMSRGQSRSHSLYFADFGSPRSYSWFELGFMSMMGSDFDNDPHAEPPTQGLGAFDSVVGGLQLAWGVVPLDIGDLSQFVDSWAERFGQAAAGRFPRLSRLPDGPTINPRGRR